MLYDICPINVLLAHEIMNQNDAKKLVQSTLEGFTITEVKDFGDIFAIYFVNNKYFKSKDPEDLPAGGGRLLLLLKILKKYL